MTRARRFVSRGLALAFVCASASPAFSQTPATPVAASPTQVAGAAPTAPTGPTPEAAPLEPRGFTFDAVNRRDPFVSMVRRGEDVQKPGLRSRPAGLPGLETSEVTLKGTVATQGSWVGILLGADSKTYIVRPGDRLLDGTIRSITQDSLVVAQQVTDPLSLEKQREVRKALRQTEEGK